MIKGHGGNIYDLAERLGCLPEEIIDMSSNVNPIGPMPGLVTYIGKRLDAIKRLPEVDSGRLIQAFAERYGRDPGEVLAGNGSTQFIYSLPRALESKKVLVLEPTYSDYADSCSMNRVEYRPLIAGESRNFHHDMDRVKEEAAECDTVFICNPNNPTGVLMRAERIAALCRACPDTYFVIDESYLPFVKEGDQESLVGFNLSNAIVLNSMSKIFRIPGLRIGFVVSAKKISSKLKQYMLPWSVNNLAQTAFFYLMQQFREVSSFTEKARLFVEKERHMLMEKLKIVPDLKVFPSTTSFILVGLPEHVTSDYVCSSLSENKILIRNCSNFHGLSDRYIRISLKSSKTNMMLAEKLRSLCGFKGPEGSGHENPDR